MTPFNLVIGVDPGVSGAMVALQEDGTYHSEIRLNAPLDLQHQYLDSVASFTDLILVERVQYIKGDGPMGAFTFGRSFGQLEAMFECFTPTRVMYITPTAWRTKLKVPFKASKDDLFKRAKVEFPENKLTKKNCDAFLLAKVALKLVGIQASGEI